MSKSEIRNKSECWKSKIGNVRCVCRIQPFEFRACFGFRASGFGFYADTADLDSKTGGATAGRKIKGTIHWVSAAHAIDAESRLDDRLFTVPEPDATGDFKSNINPHSWEIVTGKLEPGLKDATGKLRYQFERLGYFALDSDSRSGKLVFNRTITLKDTWSKIERKQA